MRAFLIVVAAMSLSATGSMAADYACRMYKPGSQSVLCEFRTGDAPCTADLSATLRSSCEATKVKGADADKLECAIFVRVDDAGAKISRNHLAEETGFRIGGTTLAAEDGAKDILVLSYRRDKNARVTKITCDRK